MYHSKVVDWADMHELHRESERKKIKYSIPDSLPFKFKCLDIPCSNYI